MISTVASGPDQAALLRFLTEHPDRVATTTWIAHELGISSAGAYDLLQSGAIPGVFFGKRWLTDKQHVLGFKAGRG